MSSTKTASLEDIRKMHRGDALAKTRADTPAEDMPDGFWDSADVQMPRTKEPLNLRVDPDILEFFKDGGTKGYQTRIHAVLRAYVDAKRG